MTTHEEIKKLYELTQAHPDLPVVYCMHQEFSDADYDWMMCKSMSSYVGYVSNSDDDITMYRDFKQAALHILDRRNPQVALDILAGRSPMFIHPISQAMHAGKLYRAIIVEVEP